MSRRKLIDKIATITEEAELRGFLNALREEDPDALSDEAVMIAIGKAKAEIYRYRIRAADEHTSKGANAA